MKNSDKPPASEEHRSGYTSEDVHRALFPEGPPPPRTLEELKDGIRRHLQQKHASETNGRNDAE